MNKRGLYERTGQSTLYKVESNFGGQEERRTQRMVQFNPETLKVSYSNQLAGKGEKKSGGQADGT